MNAYCGRFAPSPTGPLHFGSLVSAMGSWLEARSRNGRWLVRMEDLDRPRTVPGAADAILRTLEYCGLVWDGSVLYQSERTAAYAAAFSRLQAHGHLFPCGCSRKEIADSTLHSGSEPVYPGTCRAGLAPGRAPRTWRLHTPELEFGCEDAIQGVVRQRLDQVVGDFVLKRADGLFAYQLAVVVDDAQQGIDHVVRGADLLDSTPRQIYLQRLLALPQPLYAHLPVVVNVQGEKLSKQTLAPAIGEQNAASAMAAALRFLGQTPPLDMAAAPAHRLLDWARHHWDLASVPRVRFAPATAFISSLER